MKSVVEIVELADGAGAEAVELVVDVVGVEVVVAAGVGGLKMDLAMAEMFMAN